MSNAQKFRHAASVPRQGGEQARLKVVQGPDYGSIYVVTGTPVTIGRGEENDIMIADLKASRKHAELSAGAAGIWGVKDLGSANGILHNGKAVRSGSVKTSDTFTLGETTFEFLTGDTATVLLVAPPRSSAQAQAEQAAFQAQRDRVKALGGMGGGASAGPGGGGLLQNRKVVLGGVAALAFVMMMGGENKPQPVAKKKDDKEQARDLAAYLPAADPGTAKTAEQFFKAGFREYRARNYLRAKTQFETVLQMSPGHPLATLYLQNAQKEITDEISFHLDRGKKSLSAGKLKDARGHYEAVMRLLSTDQANPAFIEAKDQWDKTMKELKGDTA